ncbi:kinesin-like protein [Trebouxia sp. C0010 RCD-2024]
MRSARYFAADHGMRPPPPKEAAKEPSEDDDEQEADAAEDGSRGRKAREQRPKPDWFLHDDRDMDPGPPRRATDPQGRDNQRGRNQTSSGWDEQDQAARYIVELNTVGFSTTCLLTHSPIAGVILVSHMAEVEVEVYCTAGLPAAVQHELVIIREQLYAGRDRAAKPHVPGRTLPLLPPSSAWHYIDPEGKEQGPFDAKKLINWVDLGYFGQSDLQVKKAGKDAWVSLSTALPQIRKEAAGDFSSSFDHAKEPVRASPAPGDDQPGRGRGRGSERAGARAGRPVRRREVADLLPVLPEGKRHPAEGLLSPREEVMPIQRSQNHRGADRITPGPEQPSRADQYCGGEQGGRGSRGRGKAARGGRAARADDADLDSRAEQSRTTTQAVRATSQTARATSQATRAAAQPARATTQPARANDAAKPPSSKVAMRLFTADRQGAEEPVWRYIDPDGQVQGPFSAREMHTWYDSNYLQMDLPICGMERKVSPPDLPPRDLYKSMGQMLQQVNRGSKFRPTTVKDVAAALAAKNAPKAQERTSNDGAESVEAKQGPSGADEQEVEDAGINLDAESVIARGEASEEESDMEEGEIHGRTAATDEESDFDPDGDDGSDTSPRRAVQNQAASSTESPERPVSPQKAEAKAAFRRPASPEPAPVPAPVQAPSSPQKPASPERPEAHAARSQAPREVQHASNSSSSTVHQIADMSVSDNLTQEQDSQQPLQAVEPSMHVESEGAAEPSADMIVEEPEEEGQAGAKEDKEDGEKQSSAQHESMQIEEVLLQEGSSAQQHTGSSSQQGDSVGVMGAMMGAAKSLFGGGKHDQEESQQGTDDSGVDATQEPQTSNAQAPTIEEPDTTESEATVESYHSDHGASEVHEATASRQNSGADDIGPGEDPVAQLQEGLSNVSLDNH